MAKAPAKTPQGFCVRHKPKGNEIGYFAWTEWAEDRRKRGDVQKPCRHCGHYLFPEEF